MSFQSLGYATTCYNKGDRRVCCTGPDPANCHDIGPATPETPPQPPVPTVTPQTTTPAPHPTSQQKFAVPQCKTEWPLVFGAFALGAAVTFFAMRAGK
jgi:hypothetical protein